MGNVAQSTNRANITVRCPDGFGNQLRLALAGSFLVMKGFIKSYTQDWVINNHNNVNFLDYFLPLPQITFGPIPSNTPDNDIISTTTFEMMVRTFSNNQWQWKEAFDFIKQYLIPKENIWNEAISFIEKNNIRESTGLHVRRTCKTSFLNQPDVPERRRQHILTNEQVLELCKADKKIYLATDNKETQDWFKTRLGNKCITYGDIETGHQLEMQPYDRAQVERHTTPLHCIMDFLIVQQCRKFIGSCESSFSNLIKNIRNNKKDLVLTGKV